MKLTAFGVGLLMLLSPVGCTSHHHDDGVQQDADVEARTRTGHDNPPHRDDGVPQDADVEHRTRTVR